MAVARSSSGGVVICYVLPVLRITIISAHRTGLLDVAAQLKRRAQRTRSLGLGYKLCAVIPAAGQRTCGTTFRAFQLTSHVATTGAESAVYDCIDVLCRQNCWANGVGWTRTLSCCCRPPTRWPASTPPTNSRPTYSSRPWPRPRLTGSPGQRVRSGHVTAVTCSSRATAAELCSKRRAVHRSASARIN